jgi:hypothetical protein
MQAVNTEGETAAPFQVSKLTHQAALANLEVDQLRAALARIAGEDHLPSPLHVGVQRSKRERKEHRKRAHEYLMYKTPVHHQNTTGQVSGLNMRCVQYACTLSRLSTSDATLATGKNSCAAGQYCCADGAAAHGGDAFENKIAGPTEGNQVREVDVPMSGTCVDPAHASLADEADMLRREVARLEAQLRQLQGRSDEVRAHVSHPSRPQLRELKPSVGRHLWSPQKQQQQPTHQAGLMQHNIWLQWSLCRGFLQRGLLQKFRRNDQPEQVDAGHAR